MRRLLVNIVYILRVLRIHARYYFRMILWALSCTVLGPIVYLAWRSDREKFTQFFANSVYQLALRVYGDTIEDWKKSVDELHEKLDVVGLELRSFERIGGSELIMPPEGELLNPQEGAWIFWVSEEMKGEILEAATVMFRHRVRHYSRGTLTSLFPSE